MNELILNNYATNVKYAQFLHDNSMLKFTKENNDLVVKLPVKKPL